MGSYQSNNTTFVKSGNTYGKGVSVMRRVFEYMADAMQACGIHQINETNVNTMITRLNVVQALRGPMFRDRNNRQLYLTALDVRECMGLVAPNAVNMNDIKFMQQVQFHANRFSSALKNLAIVEKASLDSPATDRYKEMIDVGAMSCTSSAFIMDESERRRVVRKTLTQDIRAWLAAHHISLDEDCEDWPHRIQSNSDTHFEGTACARLYALLLAENGDPVAETIVDLWRQFDPDNHTEHVNFIQRERQRRLNIMDTRLAFALLYTASTQTRLEIAEALHQRGYSIKESWADRLQYAGLYSKLEARNVAA